MPQPTASIPQALAHAARLLETRPDLAAAQAAEILAHLPTHPQARLIDAAARRRLGDAAEATKRLQALAQAEPASARTQYELALAATALGETAQALEAAKSACRLNPNMPEAWRALADLLLLEGDTDAADAAYARHIQAAIHDPRLMQAAAAMAEADHPTAERLLRTHIAANPTDVAAIRMLAELGTRLGRYKDAETLLKRCLELAPSFTGARHNYAVVLFRQQKAAEAIPHIEALLAESPTDPNLRNLLAACLATSAQYPQAIAAYEAVLRDYPNQPKIWLSYGHVLRTSGARDAAITAYRTALAQAPSLGEAWWSIANLKTNTLTDADLDAISQTLNTSPNLTGEDRLHLHYALARGLEERGQYAEAFTQYQSGATLRRAQIPYAASTTTARVTRAITLFTPAFFHSRAGLGCPDPSPIFIVGLPRSGSTLIEQILASHSQIEGTMELPDLPAIAASLAPRAKSPGPDYPELLETLSPARLRALGEEYLARTAPMRKLGRPRFIDKMPNNWAHIGLIAAILPGATIIDARRHPMAACFSAYKQHFAAGQHFSYNLTELGQYYCDYVRLMAHFDATLPGRIHRVIYEDMVANPEAETARLLAHLKLPLEPACLRFWETDRAVRTASSEQVRQPIFREGLDHWRHFAPHLTELRAALQPLLTTEDSWR